MRTRQTQMIRRPARIVSVCVSGRPARQVRFNEARLDLMASVGAGVRRAGWTDLDALIFPAGYLRSDVWFGPLQPLARMELADEDDIGDAARSLARSIRHHSPWCQVIVGVDSRRPEYYDFRGDQLVFAFDEAGFTGSARKIFPVDGDTNGWGRAPYLLFDVDADDPWRVVSLANGQTGLLSVCYDAFAIAELRLGPTSKRGALRYFDFKESWRWRADGQPDAYLSRFENLIARTAPKVNLVSIHGFERPGGELRWQRHGVASASAGLGGALTVGAAHYAVSLPTSVEASPLAASRVSPRHLRRGPHRRAERLSPQAGFYLPPTRYSQLHALVRLYVGD